MFDRDFAEYSIKRKQIVAVDFNFRNEKKILHINGILRKIIDRARFSRQHVHTQLLQLKMRSLRKFFLPPGL